MQTFEVGIIGGGPGGYVTALRLHQYGINTILFEKERLGGVCLNWGCIPTKAMVRAADLFAEICRAEEFGIVTSSPRLDYTKFLEHRQQVVESLVTGIEFLFRKKKITLVKEEVKKISRVDDHYRININGNEFNMQYLVLATGSEPKALANIQPDGHHVLTSRDLLDLK
ncbi:MAG: FAD-dependent oxidoreductase, partial [Candidatus Cloacimonetes bacterium]|nr:FAD-dependent oxidoreductase [Candidatus Cloacimonadota bacterium]